MPVELRKDPRVQSRMLFQFHDVLHPLENLKYINARPPSKSLQPASKHFPFHSLAARESIRFLSLGWPTHSFPSLSLFLWLTLAH